MFDSLIITTSSIRDFLLPFWWILPPLVLFIILKDLWLKNIREQYVQKMKWILLEVKLPREIDKDARAVEHICSGLHGFHRNRNFGERYFEGKVQEWFSFEVISLAGEIRFFVRTLERNRNQVEAQFFAQYPYAEIFEVNDYTQFVAEDALNQEYNLWGTELVLTKDDAYPIRTYPAFRQNVLKPEEIVDPMASLLEALSIIGEGEQVWIQTLFRPILEKKWEKKVEKVKNKLVGRIEEKKRGVIEEEVLGFAEAVKEVIGEFVSGSAAGEKKPEKPVSPARISLLTQDEKDVVDAIEKKVAKVYFETIIRIVYLGRKEVFNKSNVSAVFGCFKQFNTQNINGFKPNKKVTTQINYKIQLKGPREFFRKKKILATYKRRYFPIYSSVMAHYPPLFFESLPIFKNFFLKTQPFVFNAEELATIYHYPGELVKAPMMPRIESKKSEPPTGLPIG